MLAHELKHVDPDTNPLKLDEAEINELLTADFLEVDDYPGLDETLAAFEHSPEYHALPGYHPGNRGSGSDHVRPLLELAAEHWLDPDDIDGALLLELIHDLPRLLPCEISDIKLIIDQLYAFWVFATRELHYPHGRACMATLRGEAVRALECAIENTCQLRAGSSPAASRARTRASSSPCRSAMVIS